MVRTLFERPEPTSVSDSLVVKLVLLVSLELVSGSEYELVGITLSVELVGVPSSELVTASVSRVVRLGLGLASVAEKELVAVISSELVVGVCRLPISLSETVLVSRISEMELATVAVPVVVAVVFDADVIVISPGEIVVVAEAVDWFAVSGVEIAAVGGGCCPTSGSVVCVIESFALVPDEAAVVEIGDSAKSMLGLFPTLNTTGGGDPFSNTRRRTALGSSGRM